MNPHSDSRRLVNYLAAAVGASATLSTQAEAAIVYFNVDPDAVIGLNGTVNFGNINLNTGTYALNNTTGTTFGLSFPGYDGGLFGYLNPRGNVEWGFNGPNVVRSALNNEITVASASNWGALPSAQLISGYAGSMDGNWGFTNPNQTRTGFAPLRINAGSGNYQYGWAEITTQAGNIFSPPYMGTISVTITGFAFNTEFNEAIQAGAIPEPSTAVCLILGGSAFAFSRRRRLTAQQSAS